MKPFSKKLGSIAGISLWAYLALVPPARAGVVDVTTGSWAPPRAGSGDGAPSVQTGMSHLPVGGPSPAYAANYGASNRPLVDLSDSPDVTTGGYILEVPRSMMPVGIAMSHGTIPLSQTADLSSALSRSDDANAHALALPDALRTLPVGVLIVALAIRRAQRAARRA